MGGQGIEPSQAPVPGETTPSASQSQSMAEPEKLQRKRSRDPDSGADGNAQQLASRRQPSNPKGKRRRRGADGRRKEMGRAEWANEGADKRERNAETKRKRAEKGNAVKPIYAVEFSKEDIASEERKPKKKVAIMVGYSGSGYKGMQLANDVKTIEGDLFGAFVAAGAVSKANADDPKKSALVRCARTDKGVHAAGNVVSMKLIVEDEDIVQKINSHLSPQIRVWGIERTNGSFSAYQACDSRIYEYLIPTHCFIPPHPESFLGKKLVEIAEEAGDLENFRKRQEDASSFWEEAEQKVVKPVLDTLDPEIANEALKIIFDIGVNQALKKEGQGVSLASLESAGDARAKGVDEPQTAGEKLAKLKVAEEQVAGVEQDSEMASDGKDGSLAPVASQPEAPPAPRVLTPLEQAIRAIKAAHLKAKLAYRITPARLERVRSTLSRYVGTHNYHNYTVAKRANDPSASRHIKSFVVSGEPFLIHDTEWVSLKVHGQSFMMHQIRKMVSMATMVVRCGAHEARIQESFLPDKLSIPRAPGLGLLLERPVFDTYNKYSRVKGGLDRGTIDFDKYKDAMDEFKQREIYERIWREEEEQMLFNGLFSALDALRSSQLLYFTSIGVEASLREIEGDMEKKRGLEAVEEEEEEEQASGPEEG